MEIEDINKQIELLDRDEAETCLADTYVIYEYELYTKNPVTKETGWDIKWVRSTEEQVKSYPDFDCIISKRELPRNADNTEMKEWKRAYANVGKRVNDWFPTGIRLTNSGE